MKKVFVLSALFVGGVLVMSFATSKNQNNLQNAQEVEKIEASILAAEAASFVQSSTSHSNPDKSVWSKWNKTWVSIQELSDASAEVVAAH